MALFRRVPICQTVSILRGHICCTEPQNHLVKQRGYLKFATSTERAHSAVMSSTGGGATLLVVGDVHNQWGREDERAIDFLNPDIVVFVGDIGNEDVDLIKQIGALKQRKAVVLGNHDAWYSLTSRGQQRALKAALQSSSLQHFSNNKDRILESLDALGDSHIGYSSMIAEDLGLVFAGARPFSKGGMQWDIVANFYKKYYNINSFEDSMSKILEGILDEKSSDLGLVVVAHNGPFGLGGKPEDPCGIDFMDPADDFGDPDLEEALEVASSCGRHASLVLFGHMHHTLKKGGYRNMVAVDESNGTVYLNAAVVPRTKNMYLEDEKMVKCRHFLRVHMQDGSVEKAENVWVAVPSNEDASDCKIVEQEVILKRAQSMENPGEAVISYYQAHTSEWNSKVVI